MGKRFLSLLGFGLGFCISSCRLLLLQIADGVEVELIDGLALSGSVGRP